MTTLQLKLIDWHEGPLLNVEQTNLLLNKLQELSLARLRPDFVESDLPPLAMSSIRLALAKNLGRAFLEGWGRRGLLPCRFNTTDGWQLSVTIDKIMMVQFLIMFVERPPTIWLDSFLDWSVVVNCSSISRLLQLWLHYWGFHYLC